MAIVRYVETTKATNDAPVSSGVLKGTDKQLLAYKITLTEDMATDARPVFKWEGSGKIEAVQSALLQKADERTVGIAKIESDGTLITMTATGAPGAGAVLTLSLIIGV
jgi:hypothetical protein